MTKDDSIIFLTDKYGRRDRTTEIEGNCQMLWTVKLLL